jgi:hypothetical protein
MEIRMPTRSAVVLSTLAALAAAGCGGKSKGADDPGGMKTGSEASNLRVPSVDKELCDAGNKKVVTSDLDHDGKADVWKLYATIEEDNTNVEVLTCKQVDFDHDGRKDYVATYLKTGEMIAEEFDFGFDGKFDAREHYDSKAGKVALVERDSDHDKKTDIWEKYRDGSLAAVHRDRNGDGKPDMWETYDATGQLASILFDDDYDNRVDRKEAARRPPSPNPNLPAVPAKGPTDENATETGAPPAAPAATPTPSKPDAAPATKPSTTKPPTSKPASTTK